MEPDESGLSSYYHHQLHQPQPLHQQNPTSTPTTTTTTTSSPTNGILPNTERAPHSHMVYPHPVPSAVSSPLETVRRKRGRPRKYGTPEQAAAAKRLSSSSPSPISQPRKKDQSLGGGGAPSSSNSSFKKSQLASLGSAGQGFMPLIITVAAGEDVAQKIMLCMQQSKREICIFSASGSISNPSLRQPATSGGNITYEGRFDILSLSGSYVRTELGGRTGGLSVCLSSADGQIIGGGLGGPLTAAGPVQVIVGTFIIDMKKDITAGVRGDASASKVPSPGGGVSVPSAVFQSAVDSSGRFAIRGSDDQQNIGGSQYMIQPRGMQATPSRSTDWRSVTDARNNAGYEFTGRMGPGAHESPENEDYEHIPDRD